MRERDEHWPDRLRSEMLQQLDQKHPYLTRTHSGQGQTDREHAVY